VTTETGAVYDLEYRRYTGARTGRAAIIWTIVLDGIRKVLGLRRKARRKILPFLIIAIAVIPAIAIVGVRVFTAGLGGEDVLEDLLPSFAEYFSFVGLPTFVFIAFTGPELFIPDRVNNVLTIYGSRPLTRVDYLLARVAALAIVVMGFLLMPQLVLYIGSALLSGDILDYVTGNLDLLWKIPLSALAVFVAYSSLVFILAAFTKRAAVAGGIYLAASLIIRGVAAGLGINVSKWFALIDYPGHPEEVIRNLFSDRRIQTLFTEVDLAGEWAYLMILLYAAAAAVVLHIRYRRLL
jgi:ABC-2 type transport system permease protein